MSTKIPLAGIGYGLIAYLIWGFFPLYFRQLGHITPMDILSNRTLGLRLRRPVAHPAPALGQRAGRFPQPGHLARLASAALLLGSNWLGFCGPSIINRWLPPASAIS
jgi:chloramphenicol-sensitive protein RarD